MTSALLAHVSSSGGGGGGGSNFLLLLAGFAAVVAGLGVRSREGRKPVAWLLVTVGVAVILTGFVWRDEPRPDVTLTLASPDPGVAVPADTPVPVSVSVIGGKVATSPTGSGGHLHLSVDGTLEQMPYGTTAEVRLPPGSHTLRVEYVDNKHLSYKPPIAVEVRVTAVPATPSGVE